MFCTDNPLYDFAMHDAEQQAELDKLPKCAECGNPVQYEEAFYINGDWICESCMNGYRRTVNDY